MPSEKGNADVNNLRMISATEVPPSTSPVSQAVTCNSPNQFRLLLAALAYTLMQHPCRIALVGIEPLERTECRPRRVEKQ